MSVVMNIPKRRERGGARVLAAAALCGSLLALQACAVFAAHNQSTVAQGKYFSAGEPKYDEFFVGLFLLQVEMEQAPHVPQLERLNLAHALTSTPTDSTAEIAQRLHDAALKLSRTGLRLRLDLSPSRDKPAAASAAVRSSGRPKEAATVALLAQIESSATALLRSSGEMTQADAALDNLETSARALDASVDADFASAPVGKAGDVKKNLADAHKLIALMKARAASVGAESEELLNSMSKAVNTDDGSLGSATPQGAETAVEDAGKGADGKKPPPKARPSVGKAAHAAAPAPRPKSAAATDDSEAAPKPSAKPSKAAAPPRDFEP
jgi:hypothetical protein